MVRRLPPGSRDEHDTRGWKLFLAFDAFINLKQANSSNHAVTLCCVRARLLAHTLTLFSTIPRHTPHLFRQSHWLSRVLAP